MNLREKGMGWLATMAAASTLLTSTAQAQFKLYTLDSDFDEGTLINLNHDAPNNNQLQLNFETQPFPFISIAVSDRGTAVRINVNTGEVLGEYSTNPDAGAASFPNPSRTTVDQFGNVWVANRGEFTNVDGVPHGSITRIGLVLGGTRVDSDGTPNLLGQYLAPPFEYNTCVDRDMDGLIKTSRGLSDILPWPNVGGFDTFGGVTTAEDESITNYVLTPGTGTRTLAIDSTNDVWVGNYGGTNSGNHLEVQVDGPNAILDPLSEFNLGCGGYGGLIDGFGTLWSAGRSSGLMRYDTNTMSGLCLGSGMGDYGIGLDPNTGNIWHSSLNGSSFTPRLFEIDPAGNLVNAYIQNRSCQGVAVDSNSHVWVAELFGDEVLHYAPDPLNPGSHLFVGYVTGFAGTTGVAVDANGKVWASEMSSSATRGAARLDPTAGPIGGGGYPVGAIDMTVGLGVGGNPYNYSDMTGFVLLSAIQEGYWNVVFDTEVVGISGCEIAWSSFEPLGTALLTEVRAADLEADLPDQPFVVVTNGVDPLVSGRFMEMRTTFSREPGMEFQDLTPVLFDLMVQCNEPPVALCQDVTVSADSSCTGNASIDAGSYDPDGDSFVILVDPPGPYPLGETLVALMITDEQGASDSCTATVTVVDTTPPVVTLKPSLKMWPPNHKYRTLDMNDFIESVSDNCDEFVSVATSCTMVAMYSDELEDAAGNGDGKTLNDMVFVGETACDLRAERMGTSNGRVYGIILEATDASGNVTVVTAYVEVPHDRNDPAAVNDGPASGYTLVH